MKYFILNLFNKSRNSEAMKYAFNGEISNIKAQANQVPKSGQW